MVLISSSSELPFRQIFCHARECRRLFFICSHCYRNHRYCSPDCRELSSIEQRRAARRRYRQSPEGRDDGRDRQREYRRRTAFGKKYVWWVKDRLEVGEMARAAELVVGRHDFAAFSERDTKRDGQSTIVHVESAEITTDEHLIRFRITASHFLWKMVRRLIGSLVEVGRGRASVEDFARLIENPRSQSPLVPARVTAPPSGLFLESVDY